MKRGSSLRVGAALEATVVIRAAAARPAAVPRVIATAHVPLVAAQGDRLSLKATVIGTGKRATVGLVLGSPTGSAKGGISLGAGVVVRHRGRKQIVVRGRVPKSVTPGALHTLLVCVMKGACHKAARIATSGTSTEERIAAARQAGRLPASKELLYRLLALRPAKRLPPELRGTANGPSGEEAPITDALDSLASLPAGTQKQVFPFFVPPRAAGSAWAPPGKRKRSEEHTSELQSQSNLVCRLLLEKKK